MVIEMTYLGQENDVKSSYSLTYLGPIFDIY